MSFIDFLVFIIVWFPVLGVVNLFLLSLRKKDSLLAATIFLAILNFVFLICGDDGFCLQSKNAIIHQIIYFFESLLASIFPFTILFLYWHIFRIVAKVNNTIMSEFYKPKANATLLEWTKEVHLDDYFKELLSSRKSKNDLILNLNKLKNIFAEKISLNDLRLIRACLIAAEKSYTSLAIAVVFLAFLLTIASSWLSDKITKLEIKDINWWDNFDMVFTGFVIYILISTLYTQFRRSITQITLIKEIFEVCIKDKEREEAMILVTVMPRNMSKSGRIID